MKQQSLLSNYVTNFVWIKCKPKYFFSKNKFGSSSRLAYAIFRTLIKSNRPFTAFILKHQWSVKIIFGGTIIDFRVRNGWLHRCQLYGVRAQSALSNSLGNGFKWRLMIDFLSEKNEGFLISYFLKCEEGDTYNFKIIFGNVDILPKSKMTDTLTWKPSNSFLITRKYFLPYCTISENVRNEKLL